MPYKYAYIVGNLMLLPVWTVLIIHRKDLRKEMILVGLIAASFAGFTPLLFLRDYWNPEYLVSITFRGIEVGGLGDFLYGFIVGGIASSIYEEVFGKRFSKRKLRKHNWMSLFVPVLVACIFILLALNLFVGLNSMYSALLSISILILILMPLRKDLIFDAVISGAIFSVITVLLFILLLKLFPGLIQRWWTEDNLSGVFIIGIPLEELLWAFVFGAGTGPFYEFFAGRRLVDNK